MKLKYILSHFLIMQVMCMRKNISNLTSNHSTSASALKHRSDFTDSLFVPPVASAVAPLGTLGGIAGTGAIDSPYGGAAFDPSLSPAMATNPYLPGVGGLGGLGGLGGYGGYGNVIP